MDPSDQQQVQSTVMVAVKSLPAPALESDNPELNRLLAHHVTGNIKTDLPILTDEFAPVDFYSNQAIK
jgi:hypothetical protein